MAQEIDAQHHARLVTEHQLYFRLLNLGRRRELMPLLGEALALVTEMTGVGQGYLELYDDDGAVEDEPRWWIAHGFSDVELAHVRSAISRGIIAEAVASGQTIVTQKAFLDPRFSARESVRLGHIEAVLCAPIGRDPARGVLYLQGRAKSGLFSVEERERAELFADTLVRLVDPLLAEHQRAPRDDATAAARTMLHAPRLIGRSEALAALLKQVAAAAPLDATVLLTGESGTGKSLLARLIHDNSPRHSQPFIDVSCGTLQESLVENELFGSEAGGHSTAYQRTSGKVEAAQHGTLFLDEIDALPFGAQAKLLQLLHSKKYFRIGGTKEVHADVRIIAATNTDLHQAVADRRFRQDLLYRLQVVCIRVPELAERRADIPDLARHFCKEICYRYGLPQLEISRGALRAAGEAEWPGNVRQLENFIEAAAIRCAAEQRAVIEIGDLFPDARQASEQASAWPALQAATRRFQAQYVRQVLEDVDWDISQALERLDVGRSQLYKLIRLAGLKRQDRST